MATPPYINVTFDPPSASDTDSVFDTKASDTFGKLNPWGTEANDLADWIGTKADQALAAATGGDLPSLTGFGGDFLRVKSDESAAEFVDIFTVLPTQSTATWEAGTSTTEGIVSPAKVKSAVDALVPDNALTQDDASKVGALAFCGKVGFNSVGYGQNIAGSSLRVAEVGRFSSSNGAYISSDPNFAGTWRCLGRLSSSEGSDFGLASLFVRIA